MFIQRALEAKGAVTSDSWLRSSEHKKVRKMITPCSCMHASPSEVSSPKRSCIEVCCAISVGKHEVMNEQSQVKWHNTFGIEMNL